MRVLISALVFLLGAGTAGAQAFGGGAWYAKGFGGATLPRSDSTTVNGLFWAFDQPTRIYPPFWELPNWKDLDYDAGYTLGAAVGYAIRPNLAVELEYAYRAADIKGSFYENATSNAVMVNAVYRFNPMGPNDALRPYLGGGLGWADLDISSQGFGTFKRDDAFAYQLIGGVAYTLTPDWSLLAEMRWFSTDSGKLSADRYLNLDTSLSTLDLLIGAAYRF